MIVLRQDRIRDMDYVEFEHGSLAHIDHGLEPVHNVPPVWRIDRVGACRSHDETAVGPVYDSPVLGDIRGDMLGPSGVEGVEPDHGI
ncbi:hypothetical protein DL770_010516 [Monosporascus sp. CRB-9-2]|nr:hypothetical protein DL770_010516 [Monosporascus sp. CRB-9-2]